MPKPLRIDLPLSGRHVYRHRGGYADQNAASEVEKYNCGRQSNDVPHPFGEVEKEK
jgi:hypothetical protein